MFSNFGERDKVICIEPEIKANQPFYDLDIAEACFIGYSWY